MHILGLTGGIASGKTTFARTLREEGIHVIDLDEIAHQVTKKGHWGYRRLVSAFGKEAILREEDEQIDRQKVADLVFNDKALRSKLNRATHIPIAVALVKEILGAWLRLNALVVLDAPLLFESKLDKICSSTLVVACDPETQLKRLLERDKCSSEHAKARIKSQMPLEEKRKRGDVVVDSSGSKEALLDKAKDLAHVLKKKKGLFTWLWK